MSAGVFRKFDVAAFRVALCIAFVARQGTKFYKDTI